MNTEKSKQNSKRGQKPIKWKLTNRTHQMAKQRINRIKKRASSQKERIIQVTVWMKNHQNWRGLRRLEGLGRK